MLLSNFAAFGAAALALALMFTRSFPRAKPVEAAHDRG
jgi:hypothetical protein